MSLRPHAFRLLERLSLLKKTPAEEDRRMLDRCVLFSGDIPRLHRAPEIGEVPEGSVLNARRRQNYVCSRAFARPRPVSETREDVLYSEEGLAWYRGRLDERLSIRPIRSLRLVLQRPRRRAARRFERATLIQGEWPDTYGDWVSEQIRCIALAGGVPEAPLLLPGFLGRRAYVRHELDRLGIAHVTLDGPALIERAAVLRKPTPLTFWREDEVAAYRQLFRLDPPLPRAGSILYLSRAGVRSEQARAARDYRSDVIAEAVRAMGGTVAETAVMRFEDFTPLAEAAETVVADHGAAMFNMMQWRPRNVVEIVTDSWWSPCFVVLGLACDVREHVVLRSDEGSDEALKARVTGWLSRLRDGVA